MSDTLPPPPPPPHGAPGVIPTSAGREDAHGGYPWDDDPAFAAAAPAEPGAPRVRHDAFTPRRKHEYLGHLVKTGCVLDACRRTGIAPATLYRHQEEDPAFLGHCETAARMAAVPIEITAWQRAVEGVEQEFACGGQVHVRRRYSDGLLRTLLQGSNPKKFGPNPGFRRKRLLRYERRQMEREIRGEIETERARNALPDRTFDEAVESVLSKIEAIERHEEPAKRAAGWTRSPDGHWIPPGYAPVPGFQLPAPSGADAEDVASSEAGDGRETPRDIV